MPQKKRKKHISDIAILGGIWLFMFVFLYGFAYFAYPRPSMPVSLAEYENDPANLVRVEGTIQRSRPIKAEKLRNSYVQAEGTVQWYTNERRPPVMIRFTSSEGRTIYFDCYVLQVFCDSNTGPAPVSMVLVKYGDNILWPRNIESGGITLLDRERSHYKFEAWRKENNNQFSRIKPVALFSVIATLFLYFGSKFLSLSRTSRSDSTPSP